MKKITPKLKPNASRQPSASTQEPPKIEFPCANYPIKVIGHNTDDFTQFVLTFMEKYDANLDHKKVTHQDSKNGKFRSVRFFMTAQSEQQLMDLYKELKATGRVVTVI